MSFLSTIDAIKGIIDGSSFDKIKNNFEAIPDKIGDKMETITSFGQRQNSDGTPTQPSGNGIDDKLKSIPQATLDLAAQKGKMDPAMFNWLQSMIPQVGVKNK